MTSSVEKRPKKSSSAPNGGGTGALTLANVREALFARRQQFAKPSDTITMTPNPPSSSIENQNYYINNSNNSGRPSSYDAYSRGRTVSQPFSNYNVNTDFNGNNNNNNNSSIPFDDDYGRAPHPGSERKKRSDDSGNGGPPPRPQPLQNSPQTASVRGSVSSFQNAMAMAMVGCNAPRRVSYYNGFLKDVVESDVGNYAAYMNYSTAPPSTGTNNNNNINSNNDGTSSCGGGERRRSSGSYDGTARRSTAVQPLQGGRRSVYDAQLAEAMVNTAVAAAAAEKGKERNQNGSPRTSELRLSASAEGARPSLYNNSPQAVAAAALALQLEEVGSATDSVTLSVTNPKDNGEPWRRSPSSVPFGLTATSSLNNTNNMAALLQPNAEEALLLFSRNGNNNKNNNYNNNMNAAGMVAELPAPPRQTLSHKQLTEAFYGRYKGGDMAKDAYLHFLKGEDDSGRKKKRKSQKSSSLAATDGGGGGGGGRRSTTRSVTTLADPYLTTQNGAATWGNTYTNNSLNNSQQQRNSSMSMFANWQWMQNSAITSPSGSPAQASLPNTFNINNNNNISDSNNYNRDAAVAMFMNSYAPGTPNTAPAFDGRRNNHNNNSNSNSDSVNQHPSHVPHHVEKKSVSFEVDSAHKKKEEVKEAPPEPINSNNNHNTNKAEERKKEKVSALKQNLQELLKKSKELYKTKTESE